MTINDGYGEGVEVEDLLADYDQWFHFAATKMIETTDPRHADAVQEGRIEFWRAFRELAEKSEADRLRFSLNRAKQRMYAVVHRGRPPTGNLHQGLRYEPSSPIRLDSPLTEGDGNPITLIEGPASLEGIEIAYHHGEIAQAINALPSQHREYVVRRFWLGHTETEIARQFGITPNGMNNRWVRTIRPALVERLEHLVGVG
jgi:DNA-directed RNA polymerase specialized sigma24 family protein